MRYLFLGLLLLAGCSGPRAGDRVLVLRDQRYVAESPHPKHRLDLFLPRGRTGFPLVLFVHGGYWTSGDRNYYRFFTGLYGRIGIALAREGIGVAVQSYRLAPEVRIEGQLDDVLAALKWVREEGVRRGGDPRRLVLAGHSAGGHLIALLAGDPGHFRAAGLDPASVAGYVALSPVLDLGHMRSRQPASFNREVTDVVFGTPPGRLARYSPRTYFRSDWPPMLIGLGGKDYPYLREQVQAAVQELRALRARPVFEQFPGKSHSAMVLDFGDAGDPVTASVVRFIRGLSGS